MQSSHRIRPDLQRIDRQGLVKYGVGEWQLFNRAIPQMNMQHKIKGEEEQASGQKSAEIQSRLLKFLEPLLVQLDAVLDRRLSNLLRSKRWGDEMIEHFLWQQSEQRLDELKCEGEEALAVWDESVLEKASSLASEGLCAVRSSVARQLKRIKPGFYTPPSGPIFVPGMHWVGVLVMGMLQSDKRSEEEKLLVECVRRWGRRVLRVWDRGFAGAPWLGIALAHNIRFVLRWQKGYKLVDGQGRKRKAWQICRGKRSVAQVSL